MRSEPEKKIEELLSALPRIEPPGDFDARIRARIASRGSTHQRPAAGMWWAKLAVPVLAAVAMAVIFFGGPSRDDGRRSAGSTQPIASDPAAATEMSTAIAQQEVPSAMPSSPRTAAPASDSGKGDAVHARREPRTGRFGRDTGAVKRDRAAASTTEPGGSFEEAGRAGNRIMPRGFEIAEDARPDEEPEPEAGYIEVPDLLRMIGIVATKSADGWRADSVLEGSVAEKSGARPGDVIIAVDTADISSAIRLKGKHDVNSITVERGGKVLKLRL